MFSVELEFTLPELEGPFGGLVASFVGNSASFDGLIAPSSMRSDPSREMASWSVTQSGSRAVFYCSKRDSKRARRLLQLVTSF